MYLVGTAPPRGTFFATGMNTGTRVVGSVAGATTPAAQMGELGVSDRLTFARIAGGRFQIGLAALHSIRGYVQDAPDKLEAGGVLLGRHVRGTPDVIVDRVTAPLPGDRRDRHHFYRAAPRHQAAIDGAWRESGGACTYLGEWHTHPQRVPTPSRVDRLDWRRKLLLDRFSGSLFFAIAGTDAVCVWEGSRWYARLSQLGSMA